MRSRCIYSIFVCCLLLFASCNKSRPDEIPTIPTKTQEVTLSFTLPDTKSHPSKSFFDNKIESWEEQVSSIICYVARDGMNQIVALYKFTAEEVRGMNATFVIPNFTPEEIYHFYVVANADVEINSVEDINTLLMSDIGLYNGDFDNVSTEALREGGFVLSGTSQATGTADDSNIGLDIEISRMVSKYAIKMSTSDKFTAKYSGSLSIDKVEILRLSDKAPLFKTTVLASEHKGFTASQVPNVVGTESQSLFYVFENGARVPSEQVQLKIYATYDEDKDFTTDDDQQKNVYTVIISENSGELLRNAYYQHEIVINGFNGSEFSSSFLVSEWNSKNNIEDLG